MTWILDTCDPESYVDVEWKPEWGYDMWHEMDSIEKNHTRDLFPRLIEPNLPLTMLLRITKLVWSWNNSLRKKASNTCKHFLLLQTWTIFDWFIHLLLTSDEKSTRWMLEVPFSLKNFLKIFIWSIPLVLWNILALLLTEEVIVCLETTPLGLVWEDWSFLCQPRFQTLWIWS